MHSNIPRFSRGHSASRKLSPTHTHVSTLILSALRNFFLPGDELCANWCCVFLGACIVLDSSSSIENVEEALPPFWRPLPVCSSA